MRTGVKVKNLYSRKGGGESYLKIGIRIALDLTTAILEQEDNEKNAFTNLKRNYFSFRITYPMKLLLSIRIENGYFLTCNFL